MHNNYSSCTQGSFSWTVQSLAEMKAETWRKMKEYSRLVVWPVEVGSLMAGGTMSLFVVTDQRCHRHDEEYNKWYKGWQWSSEWVINDNSPLQLLNKHVDCFSENTELVQLLTMLPLSSTAVSGWLHAATNEIPHRIPYSTKFPAKYTINCY